MAEKISVVIPVYNGEKFIKEAIESALNQTVSPSEIIVVDDCSTDRTEEVVKKINSERIKYVKNKTNMGRSAARNIGVEVSTGEYIFFLDHDDIWKKNYIESSIPFLKEGYDIVYSVPREFINHKGRIVRKSNKSIPVDVGEAIFSSIIGYPSATSVKKSTFIRFDESYSQREDFEFYIRSFLTGKKMKILDNYKVMIREHSHRTSRNRIFMEYTIKLYNQYKDKIPSKYVAAFTLHTSLVCLRFGNLPMGWKLLFKAISKKPALLLNSRNFINILKWAFRIDRYVKSKLAY